MNSEKVKEIKKSLKCCSEGKCEKCLIGRKDIRKCVDILLKDTLTLINELESENERLNKALVDNLEAYKDGFNEGAGLKKGVDDKLKTENQQLKDRIAELEKKIENRTLKEVVRCKDCVYFQPEYVEMENKERRPYTKEEIKNGKFVSFEKGINCGSRCERFRYWNENQYPVWFNENDFCSYGKPKPKHS